MEENNLIGALDLPDGISKKFEYIRSQLQTSNIYNPTLDLQILTLSGLIMSYELMLKDLSDMTSTFLPKDSNSRDDNIKINPIFRELSNTSDQIRKASKELGLSLESKTQTTNENNPLEQLINKVNNA